MLEYIPILKPFVNLYPHKIALHQYFKGLKAYKKCLSKKNMKPNFYVHYFIIGCHGN